MAKLTDYNYDTQSAQLDRRQKMVDALMTGQLVAQAPRAQAGQSGWTSALQGLMPAIHMMAGQYADKGVQKDREAFTQRYNDDLKTGMEAFSETSKQDKMKAITDAMASNHPQLRAFAEAEAKKIKENQLQPKDLVGISDPASVLANQNDPTKWNAKRDLGEVGGIVYDKGTLEAQALGGAQPKTVKIGGDLYEINPTTNQLKKLDNATKISTHVSVSPTIAGQRAGMETFWKGAGAKVDELGTLAQGANNLKQSLSELEALDSQGIYSNATSAPATYLANIAQVAGVPIDPTKLGNTEAYNAIITDVWQGLVSKYGGNKGVTKDEAVEIKKMLPLAASSPQARKTINRILNNVADRQLQQFRNANSAFTKAVKADDPALFDLGTDVYTPAPNKPSPVTPRAPGPKVIRFEDM